MMDVLLAAITGAGLAYVTAKDALTAIRPWGAQLTDMCFHPANHDSQGNLRVVYTGLSSMLDRQLCVFVNIYQHAMHDILGAPIFRLLLAAFGTALAIMAIEGSRKGSKKTLLALFPIYGLLANLISISVMFPLIWVPLYVFYKKRAPAKEEYWSITIDRVYGLFTAMYVGYGLPTVALTTPRLTQPDTKWEQDLLSIWQLAPILLVPLIPVFVRFFKQPSPIDRVSDPAMRYRLKIAEGKDALEKSYLLLGIVNMIIYFGMYLLVALQGIRIWDSLVLLYNAPDNLPASVSFGDLGQILTTRVFMVDFAALSLSFVLWAILDGGLKAGLLVAFVMPFIGPSAAISFYAYYRENVIQDLTSTQVNQDASDRKQ
ncbi:hypothetical protein CU097_005623 [Rhizopus azygosporus]|uniref:Uncharacterized protein n=1 Tax=Rhizopus azygosporus TaxID=86630 RepID=A0A367J6X8_RHIAZ|nr:hypothetical protein CU097_005623 [Rhizopus azygosporus]